MIAGSDISSVPVRNISDLAFFKSAMMGREVVTHPMVGIADGEKEIIFAVPVKNSSGRVGGVLYAILPCRWLVSDTIEDISMGRTGYSYIVDGTSGLMLAHKVFDKVQTMDMFHYQPWMRTLLNGECGVKTDYRDSAGNRRIAVYCREISSDWIVVSCLAKEELEEQTELLRNAVIAFAIFIALLVSAIIILAVRSITNDVNKIEVFARGIAKDTKDDVLDSRNCDELVLHRDDELGELGDALRQMTASIINKLRMNKEEDQERQLNLTIMLDVLKNSLADIVESRDENTGEHILKTATYVRIIAEKLLQEGVFADELNEDFIERIVKSAPLHDIGKIHVPDAILNKPGKLTAEEFEIMKTHTVEGGKIIEHIIKLTPDPQYLMDARDIAMYHHERWSGGGYPEGIAGDDIPLSARIMAVADVFDALVSDRAYKKGFPLEKAFAIIREESGTHFDQRIVDAFFAASEEIIRVEEEFKNKESQSAAVA